ncbi:hypothetical protein F5J12DRAFT_810842 [Pisolithus orientalis]|uniref:uncharacterized protein n=1 Tax=Pisolithus orientalis TaxID=936130 RepID=UPI002224BCC5|nr:uncharacterized protein F5J12DRAFT_810842 [Pisolithus orientalis]KAI6025858.1 hypothetical protein F5J12DRAFT_810842 [Pisolithus orientalis]
MASCGNPIADDSALMLSRPRFDKGKHCVKCKLNLGNIVIRHAVYCRDCFTPLVIVKFRRALEPHVNANAGTSKRPKLKASGSLVLGFSGGLGSAVLLDLVYKSYFAGRPPTDENGDPRGGINHPRNVSVWTSCAVCYVEVSSAIPETHERTEEMRSALASYPNLKFIPLRLEDAFDESWWCRMTGKPDMSQLTLELGKDGLPIEGLNPAHSSNTLSPKDALRAFLTALPTPTAVSRAIQVLIRLLMLFTAQFHGASHLVLGSSLTTLAVSLVSCVAQGGGHAIREEFQEEWPPGLSPGVELGGTVRVVRPLRDVTMKECAAYAWWNGIRVPGRPRLTRVITGIPGLTKDFVVRLEKDYPSTVSTIARTCAKLEPKGTSVGECWFCCRHLQGGLADWKARISIRSHPNLKVVERLASSSPAVSSVHPDQTSRLPPLDTHLCYSCMTMFTSRSSRKSSFAPPLIHHQDMPLPRWVKPQDAEEAIPVSKNRELWVRSRQSEKECRESIADFLLPDN